MCFFKKKLKAPTSTGRVSNSLLGGILFEVAPEADIFLSDKDYLLCNLSDIKRFLEQDDTDRKKYVAEKYDCDDFAYRLMGQFSVPGWSDLAIGIIWDAGHAFNCFVDENWNFYYLEPQTDGVTVKKVGPVRVIML